MQSIQINVNNESIIGNVLALLKNLKDVEIIEKKSTQKSKLDGWSSFFNQTSGKWSGEKLNREKFLEYEERAELF
jgi:hypothetical protein